MGVILMHWPPPAVYWISFLISWAQLSPAKTKFSTDEKWPLQQFHIIPIIPFMSLFCEFLKICPQLWVYREHQRTLWTTGKISGKSNILTCWCKENPEDAMTSVGRSEKKARPRGTQNHLREKMSNWYSRPRGNQVWWHTNNPGEAEAGRSQTESHSSSV